MEGARAARERMARYLDLPGDAVLDVARIVLIGTMQLAVVNHRGLTEYAPEQVIIAVPDGRVVIAGSDLSIVSITPEEITLAGNVAGVKLSE